jgi:drug/metabolite transporter (DMT)-like permease
MNRAANVCLAVAAGFAVAAVVAGAVVVLRRGSATPDAGIGLPLLVLSLCALGLGLLLKRRAREDDHR